MKYQFFKVSTLVLACTLLVIRATAQEAINSLDILKEIQASQVVADEFYDAGLFPSQRSWFTPGGPVEDNNIFVTASIGYILRSVSERADAESAVLINNILLKMEPLYEKYESRRKAGTYNFWQTIPPDLPFPNGGRLLSKESYRLPDDYDDTSLVRLSAGPDSILDQRVRDVMVSYTFRKNRKPVEKTLDKYKDRKAYEVFFADKMEQEYDVAVMSNVLLFMFDRGYELNEMDVKTIQFITDALRSGDHWDAPEAIAPSYRSTSLILYHVARLVARDKNNQFQGLRALLVQDLKQVLTNGPSAMEHIIAASSLIRLGENPGEELALNDLQKELDSFVFFQAQLSTIGWVPTMKWVSRSFNLSLLYEYMVLSKSEKLK